ncbi:MAG: cysteine desulfurase [Betaproteobacteria bacterium]
MFEPVYLDYNATTPLDPVVREAMLPYLGSRFGNASSRHEYGRQARRALDEARERVAAAVGAHPTEILFTAGGTEANNMFIKGAAACMRAGLIAVSAVEHDSVLQPARQLVRSGWRLEEIGVDAAGRLDMASLDRALDREASLVSVMYANNETGVVMDLLEIARRVRSARARPWLHSDAIQALGKLPIDFRSLGVHALSLASHKVYGPHGAGALIVDKRVEIAPLLAGSGQERGLRSGTENVAAIVGFGVACTRAVDNLQREADRLLALRAHLEAGLSALGAEIFGVAASRLPNTVFFALPAINGETLVGQMDRAGYAVSSGAACSATGKASHVLLAMGIAHDVALGAVRVSLGHGTRDEHISGFLAALQAVATSLKHGAAVLV